MKKRVLIVDDEFGLADVVGEMLTENGYAVTIAINGRLGLQAIAKERPHLVLLDVMMPVLDGIATLAALRADTETASLPVIMMTAMPHPPAAGDPPQYQALLRKPFSPDALFTAVEALIGSAEP